MTQKDAYLKQQSDLQTLKIWSFLGMNIRPIEESASFADKGWV